MNYKNPTILLPKAKTADNGQKKHKYQCEIATISDSMRIFAHRSLTNNRRYNNETE